MGIVFFASFDWLLKLRISSAIRDLKIPRQRRPQKPHIKSEFAFFQSLSRFLQLIYFVKCKRALFEQNSYEPYSGSERERKFSCRLFTSSIKSEIRHFLSWSCSDCKEMYKKAWCTCRVVVFTIQPIAILTFSSSPSWHLKVPFRWFSSSSSERATPNSLSYEQNGFQVCCRNKQRNFTNNQTICSRNTRRRWRNSEWKF